MPQKAYVVAQSITDARKIGGLLMSLGYKYQGFHNAADCIHALGDTRLAMPSLLVVDEETADIGGVELIKLCAMGDLDIPSIVAVENSRFDKALQIIHVKKATFAIKPLTIDRLKRCIEDVTEKKELSSTVQRLKTQLKEDVSVPEMIGESEVMKNITGLMERLAESSMPVLIQGESGVGKEVVARGLHKLSERYEKPFVAINCGAIPENLVESELFGHVKGAFTGATENREGAFLSAHGGTLFLDELGELPLTMQVKLLRALQEGEVTPVGSTSPISVDVRLVAATNKDLATCVANGEFREDLYYRLNVLPIDVPPLRTRGEDIILLANHFLKKYALKNQTESFKLKESAKQLLMGLPWPGNVRQLENAIYRAAIMANSQVLCKSDFYFMGLERIKPMATSGSGQWPTLEDMEKQYVLKVVATCDGNLSEAARILGISRSTLYRKLPDGAENITKESVS